MERGKRMDNTFLHSHPEAERERGLRKSHVIVDRKDWADIRAFLKANWDILKGPIDKCLIINNITWHTQTVQGLSEFRTEGIYSKVSGQPGSMVEIKESLRKAGAELDKKREMILGPDPTGRTKRGEEKSCINCVKEHDPVRECKECKSHSMWKPKDCDTCRDYATPDCHRCKDYGNWKPKNK